MSSSQYILDRINKYLEETGYPKTPVEILESMDVDILVNEDFEAIGLLGYVVNHSKHLGKVGTIKLIYVDPPHRKNWNKLNLLIANYMKRLDVDVIEFFVDSKISAWFQRVLGSKPITYIHHLKTEEYIKRVEEL